MPVIVNTYAARAFMARDRQARARHARGSGGCAQFLRGPRSAGTSRRQTCRVASRQPENGSHRVLHVYDDAQPVEPAHAFVPAIGVSQLIQITTTYLPRWTDDLLVSSLQAGRLFRVRLSGEHVISTESIDVSMRIRDLAEARDGRIFLWKDDGQAATLALPPAPAGSRRP